MQHPVIGPQRTAFTRFRLHRLSLIAVLATLLFRLAAPTPALADGREDRLLSITKTTVYGALLGGILGLASALVVRDGYEDDAVRWGIVLGAFGGFAYGIATPEEEDWDDLSLRLPARPGPVRRSPPEELVSLETFPGRRDPKVLGYHGSSERSVRRTQEVHDGGLEE